MSGSKRWLEADMEDRQQKTEELLELPEMLSNAYEEIGELRTELRLANSFKSKLPDYLIGGFVGSVIGYGLTYFLG